MGPGNVFFKENKVAKFTTTKFAFRSDCYIFYATTIQLHTRVSSLLRSPGYTGGIKTRVQFNSHSGFYRGLSLLLCRLFLCAPAIWALLKAAMKANVRFAFVSL
jgi:hypothetical protein